MKPNTNSSRARFKARPALIFCIALVAAGCGAGGAVSTAPAPANKGVGGIPMLSQDQLNKLPPDKRAQIEQSESVMEKAAHDNMERKRTGRMPGAG